MTLEEIIFSVLSNSNSLESKVSTKIYPIKVAQNKQVPFITYHVEKGTPNSGKREISSFDTYLIDIDIFSNKFSEVVEISGIVRELFEATEYSNGTKSAQFDFVEITEDYKSESEFYNKTVKIIGHIF